MEVTTFIAALHNYIVPSLIGVGSYLTASFVKLKRLASLDKSQQQTFLDKEWARLGVVRDYIDNRMEAILKENDILRERIEHLEQEVDGLREENLQLRVELDAKKNR